MADNAVRFICDNVKYILWLYIGLLIVELEVLRNEGEKSKRVGFMFLMENQGSGKVILNKQYY